jgi:hypothetical protein
MTTTDVDRSVEHVRMRLRLRSLAKRKRRLDQATATFERQRLALFDEARSLDPQFTWAEIAEIMGVTESAVANLVKRANGTQVRRDGRRR